MALNFTPPAGDMSVKVISALFGSDWWKAISGGAAGGTFIYDLVTSVNAVAFAAVGLVLSYVVVNSAVATTSEGIAMGKRYHSFWVPLRGALSVGMIAPLPTAKSLCLLQAVVLLFAYYGIGFADSLYATGLNAIAKSGGSLYSQFHSGKTGPGSSGAVIGKLMDVAADDVYLQYRAGYTGGIPTRISFSGPVQTQSTLNWIWWLTAKATGMKSYPYSPTTYTGTITAIPPGGGTPVVVGTIDIRCATPRGDEGSMSPDVGTCAIQKNAINALWPVLVTYAGGLVGELPNQPAGGSSPPPSNAMNNASTVYNTTLQNGIEKWVTSGANGSFQFMQAYKNFISQAKDTGWAYAGVYYWQILRANSYVNSLLHNQPKVSLGQSDVIKALSDDPDYQLLSDKIAMLVGAGLHDNGFISPEAYLALHNSTHRASDTGQFIGWRMTDAIHQVKQWEIAAINTMTIGLLNKTVGSIGKPVSGGLIAVKNAGDIMMDIGAGIKGADLVSGVLSAIPIAGKVAKPLKAVTNTISPVGDMLLIEGIGLAYLAPAIPFVFMALAFLAWVIFLLEAWVAAPLWAMAHALPDGEGFAGMRAQAGYIMFLNLLIKPPLIVIGFFFALILTNAMIWFISTPFMDFVRIMQANTMTGLFALGALIFIYTGLVVTIVYKCYGLITFVPDKVPSWLGQVFRDLSPHVDAKSAIGSMQGAKGMGRAASAINSKTGETIGKALFGDAKGGAPRGGGSGGAGAKLDSSSAFGEGAEAAQGASAEGAALGAEGIAGVATGGAVPVAGLVMNAAAQSEGDGAGARAGEAVADAADSVADSAVAGGAGAQEMGAMFEEMNDGFPARRNEGQDSPVAHYGWTPPPRADAPVMQPEPPVDYNEEPPPDLESFQDDGEPPPDLA